MDQAEAPSQAAELAGLSGQDRTAILEQLSDQEIERLYYEWEFWARPKQLEPEGKWLIWLILAGRGWGKSKTGAETVRRWIETGRYRRLALVARTAADVRDVMIEGDAGLLTISPPWFRPRWEPSVRKLTWPNGAIGMTYSAEEPNVFRGPAHDGAWLDEIAAWKYPEEALHECLLPGMRIGQDPRIVATTTPKGTKFMRDLVAEPTTRLTRGKTRENIANLAPTFLTSVVGKLVGTRLGRQELDAELLEDVEGALWTRARIELLRIRTAPPMRRIVVAIDPSATSTDESDEAGIVAAGLGLDGHGYVLDDRSAILSPDGWARAAVEAYHAWKGDRIIAEVNNGGEMVELTIRTVDASVPYSGIHASRGKRTRAEPVAALYEQAKVHHVGAFPELEDELCTHDFSEDRRSPNRLDALVWALSELMLDCTVHVPPAQAARSAIANRMGGF
jgi:phage terminase large subunit-like protein